MPTEIYLVKVGMTMTEGVVDEWYIPDGEAVERDQPVYRLETEKVNMDVEADVAGIVKHIVEAGTTLAPGDVVGWIFAADEPIPAVLPAPTSKPDISTVPELTEVQVTPALARAEIPNLAGLRVKASPAAKKLARERNVSLEGVVGTGPAGRIVEKDVPHASTAAAKPERLTSPAARRIAKERDVDLATLRGTGPNGRITKDDVEAAAQRRAEFTGSDGGEGVRLRGMRKVIAERMFESLRTTAQLTIEMEVCVDAAIKLRTALLDEWEKEGIRVTYTDLVIAASVKALVVHPTMNSTLIGDVIRSNDAVHMGVAVALSDGLIVPVIQHANTKSLQERAREAVYLAGRAREGSLTLDEISGGTFTVTSFGMYGVDSFTPILNAPQTGILGVGRIYDSVRWVDEKPIRTQCLRLSLTWDHRVLDGAPAAEFLQAVKGYLEAPYRLVI